MSCVMYYSFCILHYDESTLSLVALRISVPVLEHTESREGFCPCLVQLIFFGMFRRK
uniref:Uncharacterized protein n=1 Tax=Arundo donax TaxID=35708 RepID=A0A0A9EU42_ARUDO